MHTMQSMNRCAFGPKSAAVQLSRTAVAGRVPATCCRSSTDEQLRQLEQFSAGVQQQLASAHDRIVAAGPSRKVVAAGNLAVDQVEPAKTAVASSSQAEGLLELNKDTFYPYLEAAGDTLVVVDFYTDWCGPCKMIYPQLVELAKELAPKASIVKFNCSPANKELGKQLQIKVAPTFYLYKNSQKVAEMTGAKVEKLIELINQNI
eukprot:jgi/Chrzof1/13517/Cz08g00220.t1